MTTKSYFDLGDGQLYYETAGRGMPLVLTHAAFLDSRMFDAVWEPLAKHFRVIRYDMRGFGKSSPATGPLCRRDDLDQLLKHLEVTEAHLVGCSNGGQISLDLALEQPQRVKSLILVQNPRQIAQQFRSKSHSDSGVNRTPIPEQIAHD